MTKVLIDGGKLAICDKPRKFRIVRDSRHGRKGWLAADDSFSTAVDDVVSQLLVNVVSPC